MVFLYTAIYMPTAHTHIESLIITGSEAGNQTVDTESMMTTLIQYLV